MEYLMGKQIYLETKPYQATERVIASNISMLSTYQGPFYAHMAHEALYIMSSPLMVSLSSEIFEISNMVSKPWIRGRVSDNPMF
jgi:hypothetical protein